jgi:hypothetical protein
MEYRAIIDNKFHRGNGEDGFHYWLTPWQHPTFIELEREFGPFDFDPCPHPRPIGFDGLRCDWTGERIYVNPPFGSIIEWPDGALCAGHETKTPKSSTCIHCGAIGKKKGPTAWINKAIEEWRKGKTIVIVYPIDKWILKLLKAILGEHALVRNLGDVRWIATEDRSVGKGTGRHIACFILQHPPAAPADTDKE